LNHPVPKNYQKQWHNPNNNPFLCLSQDSHHFSFVPDGWKITKLRINISIIPAVTLTKTIDVIVYNTLTTTPILILTIALIIMPFATNTITRDKTQVKTLARTLTPTTTVTLKTTIVITLMLTIMETVPNTAPGADSKFGKNFKALFFKKITKRPILNSHLGR